MTRKRNKIKSQTVGKKYRDRHIHAHMATQSHAKATI